MHIYPIRHTDLDASQLELSRILDAWDPIGVYELDPQPGELGFVAQPGEYDDLIIPILDELRRGVRAYDLARLLNGVLESDYGIAGTTGEVAARITEWWGEAAGR